MAKIDPVIDIDINNLFYQLHETATKEVEAVWKGKLDVINLGVDYKNQSFVGAGDFMVVVQHNIKDISLDPKDKPDDFRKACKDALVSYIQIFAGPDSAKVIEDNDELMKPLNEQYASSESIATFPLSKLLMEEHPNSSKRALIGYYVQYGTSIEGQKKHRLYDTIKNSSTKLAKGAVNALLSTAKGLATGMFGGVFSDLKSLKMNIGGKDYNIGEPVAKALKAVADGTKEVVTIAGQKFIKVFGKTDLEELNSNFSKEVSEEFPGTSAASHIYNVDALMTNLRKEKKLNADVQSKLAKNGIVMRMEHVIGLQVSAKDENYAQFDIDSLYRCFTDALKQTKSLTSLKGMPDLLQELTSTFSKDNIVKIEDYQTNLGTNRVRKAPVKADSIDIKRQFIAAIAAGLYQLNEDAYDDAAVKQIKQLLNDDFDKTADISTHKVKRLANKLENMSDDQFKLYRTTAYKDQTSIANAIRDIVDPTPSEAKLDAFLDQFKSRGNLEELLELVKKLYGSTDSNTKPNETSGYDLYLFCLVNVLRQRDNEKQKVKKG